MGPPSSRWHPAVFSRQVRRSGIALGAIVALLSAALYFEFLDVNSADGHLARISSVVSGKDRRFERTLSIPGRVASKPDHYLCTGLKLPLERQSVVSFTPSADKEHVHHMLVYTCSKPGKRLRWDKLSGYEDCLDMSDDICEGRMTLVYAWANGAEALNTDDDSDGAGRVVVGSLLDAPYLILQTHFLHPHPSAQSAVRLELSPRMPDRILSMMMFANSQFTLAPGEPRSEVTAQCCVPGQPGSSISMYAYRVHAHAYSRNISIAYEDTHGVPQVVKWGDPQQPHRFTKVTPPGSVGLPLAQSWEVRCSYDTTSTKHRVSVGHGAAYEMCNFYMMVSSSVPRAAFCDPIHGLKMQYMDAENRLWGPGRAMRVRTLDLASRGITLGQVAGLHLGYGGDPDLLLIFHRGGREMESYDHRDAIDSDVFVVYDTRRRRVLETFGAGTARIPHGLTIDAQGNLWTTDVDAQTARKMAPRAEAVLIEVGREGSRGRDTAHLCRPTEVAVASSGDFFVADGYCNDRVMRYGPDGAFKQEYKLRHARTPHSLVLNECEGVLLVADRERAAIRVIDAELGVEMLQVDTRAYGLVYSITTDEYWNAYALLWDRDGSGDTYVAKLGSRWQGWQIQRAVLLPGMVAPHDFTVSYKFQENAFHIHVGETGPGPMGRVTLFRFTDISVDESVR